MDYSKSRYADKYLIWLEVFIWIAFSLQLVYAFSEYEKSHFPLAVLLCVYAVLTTFIALGVKALLIVLIQIRDK